jgi:hypothetical protein
LPVQDCTGIKNGAFAGLASRVFRTAEPAATCQQWRQYSQRTPRHLAGRHEGSYREEHDSNEIRRWMPPDIEAIVDDRRSEG